MGVSTVTTLKRYSLFRDLTQRRSVVTDLSGQPIGSIFPDGTNRSSRNVVNHPFALRDISKERRSKNTAADAYNHQTFRHLHISGLINLLSTRHRSPFSCFGDETRSEYITQCTRSFHEPPTPKREGGGGWNTASLEVITSPPSIWLNRHTLSASAAHCSVALPYCVIHAPAFPAATNFCNSTIANNLRNARKSVYHLPS